MSKIPPEWLYTILAACGGGARYLQGYIRGEAFSPRMFLANVVMSGFAGLMFALTARSMSFPPETIYVAAGIGGFMGTSALEFLASLIKSRMST